MGLVEGIRFTYKFVQGKHPHQLLENQVMVIKDYSEKIEYAH